MLGALPIFPLLDGSAFYVSKGTYDRGTTDCAPGYPTNIEAGDTLLLVVMADTSYAPTTPSGWTAQTTQTGGSFVSVAEQLYTKVATGSESGTVTVSGGGSTATMSAQILNYRGIAVVDSTIGDADGYYATLSFQDNNLGGPQIAFWTNTEGMTPIKDRDIFVHLLGVDSGVFSYMPREGFEFLLDDTNGQLSYSTSPEVQRTFNIDPAAGLGGRGNTMLVTERQLLNHTMSDRPTSILTILSVIGDGDRPRASGILVRLRPNS